jgi:DNA-damage-inducible protein J
MEVTFMAKEAMIRARIEPDLKRDAEAILSDLFYTQVKKRRGLPFRVEIPNRLTRRTLEKTDRGEELISCQNAEDMFEKLGI